MLACRLMDEGTATLYVRVKPRNKRRFAADAERHGRSMAEHIDAWIEEHAPELEDERTPAAS